MDIASAIKGRRQELGLTLVQLEERSGVSRAMLSAVERGERSPTIHILCNIAAGLGCTVGSLVDEIAPQTVVQKQSERFVAQDPESGARRSLLSPSLVPHGIELVHYGIPGSRSIGPFPPAREGYPEHITVLAGELIVSVDGMTHRLEAGDSITYMVSHALELGAATDRDAEFLLVLLPATRSPLLEVGASHHFVRG